MKKVAVLVLLSLILGVVEPACARTWGEWFAETAAGGVIGAAVGGAVVLLTGGAALPIVAGAAVMGAAAGAADENTRPAIVKGGLALVVSAPAIGVGATTAAVTVGATTAAATTGRGAAVLGWLRGLFRDYLGGKP